MRAAFQRFARRCADVTGSPGAFLALIVLTCAWLVWARSRGWVDFTHLVLSDVGQIGTLFLLVLLQNSQNHDSKAMHLKDDEIIRGVDKARDEVAEIEKKTDEEIEALRQP